MTYITAYNIIFHNIISTKCTHTKREKIYIIYNTHKNEFREKTTTAFQEIAIIWLCMLSVIYTYILYIHSIYFYILNTVYIYTSIHRIYPGMRTRDASRTS